MFRLSVFVALISSVLFTCFCQEYDFAAEISRQCLVPDPVGLLDCVEDKVTLPYLTSWVDCTNSLGQNVRTSADIINYRCKSVWEGKDVIPEVFYIKDCVIEKTGLPAKNVSAEVLGAYKECEGTPKPQQQSVKTAPIQQQPLRVSSVEYGSPVQQFQPVAPPTTQQFQAPAVKAPPQQFQAPVPIQQIQTPVFIQPQNVAPVQQFQLPAPRTIQQFQLPAPRPVQQQIQNVAPVQPFQLPAPRPIQQQIQNVAPVQPFQLPASRPIQQQIQMLAPGPAQQVPYSPSTPIQQSPVQYPQYQVPVVQYRRPAPMSQQYFAIYPQVPLLNRQQNVNNPSLSQKTAQFVPQQQVLTSASQVTSTNMNVPYSYSFQITHPMKPAL